MAAVTEGRKTRRIEILEFICRFARENNGVTPSIRVIATNMGMGRGTVEVHLRKLHAEGRIGWVEGRLKVERSIWDPPEDVEL